MSQHSVKFDETKRHAVYLRDGYKCGYTGQVDKTYTGVGLSLDHIKARANGGAPQNTKLSRGSNLITAAQSANYAKQDKTPKQWEAYCKASAPPDGGVKVDFKDVRKQAGGKLDLKRGEELAKNAKDARAARGPNGEETKKSREIAAKSAKIVDAYHAEKQAKADKKSGDKKDGGADKPAGPGIQHDDKGRFTGPGKGSMAPRTDSFRATLTIGESLAIDPGGGGLIATVLAGGRPSPQALGFFATVPGPLEFDPEAIDDGIAIFCISGPIEHHDHGWWHSYEAIARELECALKCANVRAVILKIDSPGGVAAGMGENHRAIRRMQHEYGKDIFAFGDELMCSAAYNLGSACREVWTTPEGHVGSVGVILCTVDETKRLEREGTAVRYLVTGERKADLHPATAVTDDVVRVAQAKVDKLGRHFFRAVSKARAGAGLDTPEKVRALQAGVYVGGDAVKAGLADGVAGWDEFLRIVKRAAAPKPTSSTTPRR